MLADNFTGQNATTNHEKEVEGADSSTDPVGESQGIDFIMHNTSYVHQWRSHTQACAWTS